MILIVTDFLATKLIIFYVIGLIHRLLLTRVVPIIESIVFYLRLLWIYGKKILFTSLCFVYISSFLIHSALFVSFHFFAYEYSTDYFSVMWSTYLNQFVSFLCLFFIFHAFQKRHIFMVFWILTSMISWCFLFRDSLCFLRLYMIIISLYPHGDIFYNI